MITSHDIARAVFVVDQSRIVDILVDGYRTDNRGRPANRTGLRLMLIGLLLSISHDRSATIANTYEVLTVKLPIDAQLELGISEIVGGQVRQCIHIHNFYVLEKTICERLAYTTTSAPGLDPTERQRRHDVIRTYCDALMNVFQILDTTTSTVAIDATGVWSWCKGYGQKNRVSDDGGAIIDEHEAELDDSDQWDLVEQRDDRTRRRDPDATWGIKTSKSGKLERYFGYAEHTVVQVPDDGDPADSVPALISRFELTSASADVVDVTLRLIDDNPTPISEIIVDRHYHYKQVDRWKRPLVARGIRQHLDLRADEHGFTEFERMRWVAGAAHCPATPDHFATIEKPGFIAPKSAWEAFHDEIDRRSSFAMALHDRPGDNGTHRVSCPAVAGKVGCPLRPSTMEVAVQIGLPIVEDPPSTDAGEPLPKCCTQQTVRITPPESQFKLMQPHTWGTKKWRRVWNRRTFVEGSYGNRKNPSTENVRRGHNQVFGLVWMHIAMGLVNASYNLRMLENWCDRHPDHGLDHHPLIAASTESTVGHVFVTADEFHRLMCDRIADAA